MGETRSGSAAETAARSRKLKARLLDRLFHSRAKRSAKHAVGRGEEYKKADTAVRAAQKAKKGGAKRKGGAAGPLPIRLDGSLSPSQLHALLGAQVQLNPSLSALDKVATVSQLKALVDAYG
eukprot:4790993-Prymnesium_polylepis.1